MTYRVLFSPEASEDLEDILVYLAPLMGAAEARAYVGRIRAYCTGFSQFPQRGTRRDDVRPGLRLVGYRRRATIAFLVEQDVVMILRVFNRGRDIAFDDQDGS
jgi:toxin ParE1/3/4